MSEIDQQFIEYVVKSLVGKPDAVHIERRIDEKGVLLELTVDPEDLGRVIGKRGATAQSLRTLLRALGTKNDARYNLKIVDNGAPGAGSSSRDDTARDDSTNDSTTTSSDAPADSENTQPSDDDTSQHEQPTESAAEEPSTPKLGDEPRDEKPEEATSDRLKQAREELADLDDLDV